MVLEGISEIAVFTYFLEIFFLNKSVLIKAACWEKFICIGLAPNQSVQSEFLSSIIYRPIMT